MTDYEALKAWVEARCTVEGNCWNWRMSLSGNNVPQTKFRGKWINARRFLLAWRDDRPLNGKWIAVTKCENPICVNPDHLKASTRSKRLTGRVQTVTHVAKVAQWRRDRSKLTLENIQDIRYGEGPIEERAKRNGISETWARQIANGEAWKEYSSPFAGLFASNDSRKAA